MTPESIEDRQHKEIIQHAAAILAIAMSQDNKDKDSCRDCLACQTDDEA